MYVYIMNGYHFRTTCVHARVCIMCRAAIITLYVYAHVHTAGSRFEAFYPQPNCRTTAGTSFEHDFACAECSCETVLRLYFEYHDPASNMHGRDHLGGSRKRRGAKAPIRRVTGAELWAPSAG